MALKLAALLLTYGFLVLADKEDKIVQTAQGPVRGFLNDDGYFEFYGIPYANVPKGEHKFKAPIPPSIRHSVLEATRKVICPQYILNSAIGSLMKGDQHEDCLVVNVFVPKTENDKLPVLVYVHGGAFILGFGDIVEHGPLIEQEIIVINFNYRLGVQGYLCLGTKDIPGNAGMKDQVAALRWVKDNIASFGGDPEKISIAGPSAGASSVEHLMLSPIARGLFKGVIQESGSAISAWAINPDPIATARRYMNDISGKDSDDIVELEDFFKELTSEQLTQIAYLEEPSTTFEFVPCVEPEIEGEESFYNESPLNILENGKYDKVPIMSGFSSEEGLFRIERFDDWSVRMNKNFADFLPQDLIFHSENVKKHVAEKVKKFYFGDKQINVDSIRGYVDYFTDVIFAYSIIRAARIHAENSVPVYLYDYSFVSAVAMPYSHMDKIKGANHVAQTFTLNRLKAMTVNYTNEDIFMQDRLSNLWANFVKFGTPNGDTSEPLPVAWHKLDPKMLNYLHIDLEMKAGVGLLEERVRFWDSIYKDYYRPPVVPGETYPRNEL